MGRISQQIAARLPQGMTIPEPMLMLFDWAEERAGCYKDGETLACNLSSGVKWNPNLPDGERIGGTEIRFRGEDDATTFKYWFGRESKEITDRLCTFAWSGGEGSMAAFWLDPAGGQKIVHMGSGSGSTLTCVLAEDPVDFLRLIAIGYDEICWDERFPFPPNTNSEHFLHPYLEFQDWVSTTFNVSIPRTASEIVCRPANMDDESSDDPFWKWTKEQAG